MKFGYLGPNGTFSSFALSEYIKNNKITAQQIEFRSLYALFQGLNNNECDKIIAPIENSTQGSVQNVMDFFLI